MDEWLRLLEATFRANNAFAKARKDAAYPLMLRREAEAAASALKAYTDFLKSQEKVEVFS